jgi:hypothetical protein
MVIDIIVIQYFRLRKVMYSDEMELMCIQKSLLVFHKLFWEEQFGYQECTRNYTSR